MQIRDSYVQVQKIKHEILNLQIPNIFHKRYLLLLHLCTKISNGCLNLLIVLELIVGFGEQLKFIYSNKTTKCETTFHLWPSQNV